MELHAEIINGVIEVNASESHLISVLKLTEFGVNGNLSQDALVHVEEAFKNPFVTVIILLQ
jgi:hypothetical protein